MTDQQRAHDPTFEIADDRARMLESENRQRAPSGSNLEGVGDRAASRASPEIRSIWSMVPAMMSGQIFSARSKFQSSRNH